MSNRNLILKSLVGTPVTIFFQDCDGKYCWFVNPQSIWLAADRTGFKEADFFSQKDLAKLEAAKAKALETDQPQSVEVTAVEGLANGKQHPWHLRLTVNRAVDQETGTEGFAFSCIDVSDQKQREQTLKNLLREVAHRSKNMLSMVLSLSAQTARVSPTKQDYIRRFTGRLQSLAKSQDVITDHDWQGSKLSELVERQVAGVIPMSEAEVEVTGDNLELGPNGTLHVGLALHELVSNALLHGALTSKNGKIAISCKHTPGNSHGAIMTWTETPRIHTEMTKPASFGRTMLERIVPAAVNGTGVLDFNNDAVVYTLKIGESEIV